ncbi:hypothetical protein [Halorussus aquaticus]|uniref:PD-(D/E)XK nuclease superfamily protein n=1 Tax=Halorussus aquaticus TaxID=2953748 RepID=A0ABD5Q837_9EURY|nr:hypothetical protein [Halorussus aquaticus]
MVTGVTSFISFDDVRSEIDSSYPNPGQDVEADLQISNNGYSHRLVGNCVEFLCRVWLYRQCDSIIRPNHPAYTDGSEILDRAERWGRDTSDFQYQYGWNSTENPPVRVSVFDGFVWEDENNRASNREEWEEQLENRADWRPRPSPLTWRYDEELRTVVEQFIETGMNTEGVVKAALLNAGWQPDEVVTSWVDRAAIEDELRDEMASLFQLLREQAWTDGEHLMENPRFGMHQHILPGEGDFIIDNLLVDIKTTEKGTFTPAYWRQLLLYYVLVDIQRELYEVEGRTYGKEGWDGKYPEVSRVGIYFARHGELQTVDMDDLLTSPEYERFRARIVDMAIEENRHAQHDYSAIRGVLTEPYDYERQRSLSDF